MVDLVRGAEAVEEVEERHPAAQRGGVGDQREVVGLLHRAEHSMANPVVRAAITSLWSPKIDRAWVATVRAATWMTVGVSSPAILYMLGSISSRPCDAVKVRGQRPRLQGAVERPGGAGLALHLDDLGHHAPEVRTSGRATRRRPARPSATPA